MENFAFDSSYSNLAASIISILLTTVSLYISAKSKRENTRNREDKEVNIQLIIYTYETIAPQMLNRSCIKAKGPQCNGQKTPTK